MLKTAVPMWCMPTSNSPRPHWAWVLAASFTLVQPAWAVSKADLEREVRALQQQVGAIDARLGKLEGALRQTPQLLPLLQEVEALKAEIARLRGQAELQSHRMDTLGKRQNDLYADLDQRVADLARTAQSTSAAAPAAAEVPPQVASPDAAHSYEAALNLFRNADYNGAIAGFTEFIQAHPDNALASNAQYWIGQSHYALKNYPAALAHQQKLVATYPDSNKVPDALLNIAASQLALKKVDDARKTLQDLVARYPGTNAATLAARRLSALQ